LHSGATPLTLLYAAESSQIPNACVVYKCDRGTISVVVGGYFSVRVPLISTASAKTLARWIFAPVHAGTTTPHFRRTLLVSTTEYQSTITTHSIPVLHRRADRIHDCIERYNAREAIPGAQQQRDTRHRKVSNTHEKTRACLSSWHALISNKRRVASRTS
jgi:hypothetical protein